MTTNIKLTACSVKAKSYIYFSQRTKFFYSDSTPHDAWSLLICEGGLVDYRVLNQNGRIQAGDIVLCPPNEVLHRKALTTMAFHFAVFELSAFSDQEQVPFPYYGKFTFHNKTQFSLIVNNLKESIESVSMKYTEHLISDVLYHIIQEKNSHRQKPNHMPDPVISKAIQYIHEHVFDEVSTQSAADYVGLYQSQFTRKFQKAMGIPPSKYITKMRVQKAMTLLVETEEPLESIAYQCGYQNAFYLSRVFSKEMKMSPSSYRHMHQV